jgi:F-type H+-transporting ATPase subunit b
MPQLNPEFFLSQLFWLVVTFSFLLFFLWKISLPRISEVFKKREIKINNDIQTAKKLQAEAEEIQSKIDKQLHAARNQAARLIKESTINFQNNAADKLKNINNELTKKIDESAKIINENKRNALENIDKQIQEIAKLTLSKISKIKVTDQEIINAVKTAKQKLVN